MTWWVYIGRENECVGRVQAGSRAEAYRTARERFADLLGRADPLTGKQHSLFVTQSIPGQ